MQSLSSRQSRSPLSASHLGTSLLCASLLSAALLLTACGDPLAGGDYLGDPLVQVGGAITVDAYGPGPLGVPRQLRIALFWSRGTDLEQAGTLDGAVTQDVAARGAFPARYELAIYEPPSAAVLRPRADGPDTSIAVALMVLYVDANGDGRWDRKQEPVLGGAPEHALAYCTREVTLAGGRTLSPGYHPIHLAELAGDCPPPDPDGEGEGEALPGEGPEADDGSATYGLEPPDYDAVDLVITEEVELLVPDLDCDGHWGDWDEPCAFLLAEASTVADEEEREWLLEEYERCLEEPPDPEEGEPPVWFMECEYMVLEFLEELPQADPAQLGADYLACARERGAEENPCWGLDLVTELPEEPGWQDPLPEAYQECERLYALPPTDE